MRSGLLFQKIRYVSRKRSEYKNSESLESVTSVETEPDDLNTIAELIEFFKKCALPENKSDLLTKLSDSAGMRKYHLDMGQKAICKSSLNLYLVCPDLVNILFCCCRQTKHYFINRVTIIYEYGFSGVD